MTTKKQPTHFYNGRVAGTLADGRPVEPGDEFTLSAEQLDDPHNQAMIERGEIMATDKEDKK